MGFEVDGELVGLFEAQHQLAGAGGGAEEQVELGEELGVGAVERNADAEGVGQLDFDVFEGLDAGDGELWGGVFVATEGAADEDGDVDLELLGELFVGLREGDEFDLADGVLEAGGGVHLAGALGFGDLEAGDDACDLNLVGSLFAAAAVEDGGLGLHLAGGGGVDDFEVAELVAVLVEGVAGDEEAEDVLFVLEAGVFVPVGSGREGVVGGFGVGWAGVVEHAEESVLTGGGVSLGLLGALDGFVEGGEDARAGTEGVKGAGFA